MEPININEFIIILKGLKHTLVKSQLYEQAALLREFENDIYKLYGTPDKETLDACAQRLNEGARISNENYVINFGKFILANYKPHIFIYNNKVDMQYSSNTDVDPWDGNPNRPYTTEQVFAEYQKYVTEEEKKKIEIAIKNVKSPDIEPPDAGLWIDDQKIST